MAPALPPVNAVGVVIVSCGLTVKVNCRVDVTPLLSVTWIVNVATPPAVGVPVIWPVVEFKDSPAGKAPALTV